MLDIEKTMRELSRDRPLFHSEADFQHALAWQIHKAMPDCCVRLEYKPFADQRMYLDLWLDRVGVAIELKYRTRNLTHAHDGETFELRNQAANPVHRYEFLKDLQRLERLSDLSKARAGFAILLTNDDLYWKEPKTAFGQTIDSALRLHQGQRFQGELAWSENASAGTRKGREPPILLGGSYKARWRDYAAIDGQPCGEFRYLAIRTDFGLKR